MGIRLKCMFIAQFLWPALRKKVDRGWKKCLKNNFFGFNKY